jgi:hypothetical protein
MEIVQTGALENEVLEKVPIRGLSCPNLHNLSRLSGHVDELKGSYSDRLLGKFSFGHHASSALGPVGVRCHLADSNQETISLNTVRSLSTPSAFRGNYCLGNGFCVSAGILLSLTADFSR